MFGQQSSLRPINGGRRKLAHADHAAHLPSGALSAFFNPILTAVATKGRRHGDQSGDDESEG
jgi:hypothetical protein